MCAGQAGFRWIAVYSIIPNDTFLMSRVPQLPCTWLACRWQSPLNGSQNVEYADSCQAQELWGWEIACTSTFLPVLDVLLVPYSLQQWKGRNMFVEGIEAIVAEADITTQMTAEVPKCSEWEGRGLCLSPVCITYCLGFSADLRCWSCSSPRQVFPSLWWWP